MRLGISSGVIRDELVACQKILQEWEVEISKGLPGVDREADEEELNNILRNFVGEILYVSDKLASLATRTTPEE